MNIYVGNLPYDTTDQDLVEHFKPFGVVDRATLVFDRETGRPRGFAFVEMPNHDEGAKAIEALAGQPFNNRPLTINEARPRGEAPTNRHNDLRAEHPSASSMSDSDQPSGSRGYSNSVLSAHDEDEPQAQPRDEDAPSRGYRGISNDDE
ncbi:MAG: RNA-binding protein [Phycisphaeraceae bacterium]